MPKKTLSVNERCVACASLCKYFYVDLFDFIVCLCRILFCLFQGFFCGKQDFCVPLVRFFPSKELLELSAILSHINQPDVFRQAVKTMRTAIMMPSLWFCPYALSLHSGTSFPQLFRNDCFLFDCFTASLVEVMAL